MSDGVPSVVERAVRPLNWSEREGKTVRWWEATAADLPGRRVVVVWLRGLGKVVWQIAEGDRTLALGFVDSLEQPGEEQLAAVKRSAAQWWWELSA
jgi:hypothetical protein